MQLNPQNGYLIKSQKQELREKFSSLREQIVKDKKLYDTSIMHNFTRLDEYKNAKTLLIYISMGSEINSRLIIEKAWSDNKKVAVPRVDVSDRSMEFFYFHDYSELESTIFNLREPKKDLEKVVTFADSICAVPGLSFDTKGYRLGYGMGFYDRFLSHYQSKKIGLCYASHVLYELPHGFFDRKIDILVTENFVKRI